MKKVLYVIIGVIAGVAICAITQSLVAQSKDENYVIACSTVPNEQRSIQIIGHGGATGLFGPQKVSIAVDDLSTELFTLVWNDGGTLLSPVIEWEGKTAHIIISGCEQPDIEYYIDCSNSHVLSIAIDENQS